MIKKNPLGGWSHARDVLLQHDIVLEIFVRSVSRHFPGGCKDSTRNLQSEAVLSWLHHACILVVPANRQQFGAPKLATFDFAGGLFSTRFQGCLPLKETPKIQKKKNPPRYPRYHDVIIESDNIIHSNFDFKWRHCRKNIPHKNAPDTSRPFAFYHHHILLLQKKKEETSPSLQVAEKKKNTFMGWPDDLPGAAVPSTKHPSCLHLFQLSTKRGGRNCLEVAIFGISLCISWRLKVPSENWNTKLEPEKMTTLSKGDSFHKISSFSGFSC